FEGGGIFSGGTLTITNTTISGNTVHGIGGGICVTGGGVAIADSSIFDNESGRGGGIFNASHVFAVNTGIFDNTAEMYGGGVYNSGEVALTNVTLWHNHAGTGGYAGAGGGLDNHEGFATLTNTTVSANFAGLGGGILNVGPISPYYLKLNNSIVAGNGGSDIVQQGNPFAAYGGVNIFSEPNKGDAQDVDGAD